MSDNNAPLKLKLKSTDTNKFRVVNEEAAKTPAPNEKAPDASASATQQVVDPISLRDTATGRLRKISENQDAMAAAPITMATPQSMKTQTVRLKVVRQDSKAAGPQTLRPTTGTTAAPKMSLRKDEGTPVLNPDENTGAPKLQLKNNDAEKAPAASETQNVQPPAAPATLKLKLDNPAGAPAPTATQSVQAPQPAEPLKISLAKPAENTAPAAAPVTVKTAGAPAAAPSPAATQSVSAPAQSAAPAEAKPSSPSATVKLAMPKLPKKPTSATPAASATQATATPAATSPAVKPAVASPAVKPAVAAAPAAPVAPKAVPSLKKPATAGTPTNAPTLKKPVAPATPVATPTPAPQNDEASADAEEMEAAPAGISKWVSISTIVACAALIGAIVYQVLIGLKMLM